TTEAGVTAPAGLAIAISGTALASTTAGTGTTLTLLKFMAATKLKLGMGALVIAAVTTALVVQHHAQIKLRAENESLRQQIEQLKSKNESLSRRETAAKLLLHLPAPSLQTIAPANPLPPE